jgi:hypothetical protein
MGYSGAGGKLIHEKNQRQKSRDNVPLNVLYCTACVFKNIPQRPKGKKSLLYEMFAENLQKLIDLKNAAVIKQKMHKLAV